MPTEVLEQLALGGPLAAVLGFACWRLWIWGNAGHEDAKSQREERIKAAERYAESIAEINKAMNETLKAQAGSAS